MCTMRRAAARLAAESAEMVREIADRAGRRLAPFAEGGLSSDELVRLEEEVAGDEREPRGELEMAMDAARAALEDIELAHAELGEEMAHEAGA
jgi:hypothetical protein